MTIKMLGTGNISSADFYSSFLINESLLVGTPPGTTKKLHELNINIDNIQIIIIHDLSGMQIFDLPFIIYDAYKKERKSVLIIIGPENTKKTVRKLLKLAFNNAANKYLSALNISFMDANIVQSNEITDDLILTAIKTERSNYRDSFGYILKDKDKELGVVGEIKRCPGFSYILKRVDHCLLSLNDDRLIPSISSGEFKNLAKDSKVIFLPVGFSNESESELKEIKNAKILKAEEQFYI